MPSPENDARKKELNQLVVHHYPIWLLRFWHGMEPGAWLRILLQNRFRVHPTRFYVAFTVTAAGPLNAFFRLCQDWLYGQRIARTEIGTPPVFIIGHWRSGTTFLHELLAQDERFGYPTTYECFAPRHFLVSQWIMPRLLGFLLPRTRPMDNMDAAFHLPQEDEFALANMGYPTPYLHLVFPNQPPCYMELLDMEEVPPDVLERWKEGLFWFAKALTFSKKRPLILKSPPHTGRVQILSELFPGARFIHMTRHPETMFASTRRLWASLRAAQGLQIPDCEQLDPFIFECFERMYRAFEKQRPSLPPECICDVRYEDLVQDPLGQLQSIYERLHLGDFEQVRPKAEALVAAKKGYQPNRHDDLEPDIRDQIRQRWAFYYERYGYVEQPACVQ